MSKKSSKHNESEQKQAPSHKLGNSKWLLLSLLFLGISAAAGIYLNRSIQVEKISVEGTTFTNPEDIRKNVDHVIGMNRDSLHMVNLIERVEKVDYVKRADLAVQQNGTLTIYVQEREPLALLVENTKKIFVDSAGVLLPMRYGKQANVPLLYGINVNSMNDTLNSTAFRQVKQFLLSAKQNALTWATISEVSYTDKKGVVAIGQDGNVKLIFGQDKFDRRIKYWNAYYKQVFKHKPRNTSRIVDLRFEGQIVTRDS